MAAGRARGHGVPDPRTGEAEGVDEALEVLLGPACTATRRCELLATVSLYLCFEPANWNPMGAKCRALTCRAALPPDGNSVLQPPPPQRELQPVGQTQAR